MLDKYSLEINPRRRVAFYKRFNIHHLDGNNEVFPVARVVLISAIKILVLTKNTSSPIFKSSN